MVESRALTEDEPAALMARKTINIATLVEKEQHIMPATAIRKDTKYIGLRPNRSPKVAHMRGKNARK